MNHSNRSRVTLPLDADWTPYTNARPVIAAFMPVNDLDTLKDLELYDRLLNEFPQ